MNENPNASNPPALPAERGSVQVMNAHSAKEQSLGLTFIIMGVVTFASGMLLSLFAAIAFVVMTKLFEPATKDAFTLAALKQFLFLCSPGASLATLGGWLFRLGKGRLNLGTAWGFYSANSQVCTENGMEHQLVDISDKKASRDASKIQASGLFAFMRIPMTK